MFRNQNSFEKQESFLHNSITFPCGREQDLLSNLLFLVQLNWETFAFATKFPKKKLKYIKFHIVCLGYYFSLVNLTLSESRRTTA